MAEPDDPAEAARRLEAALDRIERLARSPRAGTSKPSGDLSEMTARLDALIGELRAALTSGETG